MIRKNKWQKILFIMGLILFFASQTQAATENGITVTESRSSASDSGLAGYYGDVYTKEATRFNSFNISDVVGTGTYVYNEANGTTSAAGSVNVKGLEELDEMLTVNGLAGGTITASVEIGIGSNTTWYQATTIDFNATNTTNFVNIVESCDRVRIGWKKSILGSATVSNISSYKGNIK